MEAPCGTHVVGPHGTPDQHARWSVRCEERGPTPCGQTPCGQTPCGPSRALSSPPPWPPHDTHASSRAARLIPTSYVLCCTELGRGDEGALHGVLPVAAGHVPQHLHLHTSSRQWVCRRHVRQRRRLRRRVQPNSRASRDPSPYPPPKALGIGQRGRNCVEPAHAHLDVCGVGSSGGPQIANPAPCLWTPPLLVGRGPGSQYNSCAGGTDCIDCGGTSPTAPTLALT